MDQVVYWYRVHPKDASCYGGSSAAIRNADLPSDAVFAWALVKQPATISITVGSNQYWTFEADNKGPSMSMVPFPSDLGDGVTPEVAIMRNGKTVYDAKGSQAISSSCSWQNFNPNVNLVGQGINSGMSGSSAGASSTYKSRRGFLDRRRHAHGHHHPFDS